MVFAPISSAFKYELRVQIAFRDKGVASDEAVGVRPGRESTFCVGASEKLPGEARSSQDKPWTPWKHQTQPGAAIGIPGKDPGRLGRATGSPGVPRSG